ncbi:MAG: UbiD family decarboxylase, partial [Candidatus Hodarchaeota archaeon]
MEWKVFDDLREYIKRVEELGECRVIEGADWELEIGYITELATHVPVPPLVLFDNIKGYPPGYRVVSNALHSDKRISLALGLNLGLTGTDLVRAWR